MSTLVTAIHLVACLALVFIVLLQRGKGAEMGAVFGGSSSTVFGSSGAGNFLTRLTTVTAAIFMLTSLGLTYLSTRETTATVFDTAPAAAPPAVPGSGAEENPPPEGTTKTEREQGAPPSEAEQAAARPAAAAPEPPGGSADVPAGHPAGAAEP